MANGRQSEGESPVEHCVNEGFSPYMLFDPTGTSAGFPLCCSLRNTVLKWLTVFAITIVLQSFKKAGSSDNCQLTVSTATINDFAGIPSIISAMGRTYDEATRVARNKKEINNWI